MESTAILGDYRDILPGIPDGYFDLAIVDPPYGLGAQFREGMPDKWRKFGSLFKQADSYNDKRWDSSVPGQDYFDELFRVSREQIIWGGNYFTLPPCRCNIVWDKKQTVDNFSAFELAWTSFDMPAAIYRCADHGIFRKNATIHPTQKPVSLYKWLLMKYAKPGWRILDTHLGSGSHRIAAWDLGFDFVGIEIDQDYFDPAEAWFNDHASRPEMFTPGEMYQIKQVSLFE